MESQNTTITENSTTQSTQPEHKWCNPCHYALDATRSCVTCGNHAHCWCLKTSHPKKNNTTVKVCCICFWGISHEKISTIVQQFNDAQNFQHLIDLEYPENDEQDS